jgi:hypothetical protein
MRRARRHQLQASATTARLKGAAGDQNLEATGSISDSAIHGFFLGPDGFRYKFGQVVASSAFQGT